MIDVNAFTNDVKTQILGWLSSIGTNLVCPIITAAAIIYCIFQLPQLFKAHRDGMSDVFWECTIYTADLLRPGHARHRRMEHL